MPTPPRDSGPKLTAAQVLEIRHLSAEEHLSGRALARRFGVTRSTIADVLAHRTHRPPTDLVGSSVASVTERYGSLQMTGSDSNAPHPVSRLAKLTWEDVAQIRAELAVGTPRQVLADRYQVQLKTIRRIHLLQAWIPGAQPNGPPGTPGGAAGVPDPPATKGSHTGPRPGNRLSIEQINDIWEAYRVDQSLDRVAAKCGFSFGTVKRYVTEGDHERGVQPLAERLRRLTMQQQARADQAQAYTLEKARDEQLRTARALLGILAKKIASADPEKIPEAKMTSFLKEIQQIMDRIFGVADITVAARVDRFEGWSTEEIMLFATTGALPAHDMVPIGSGGGTTD